MSDDRTFGVEVCYSVKISTGEYEDYHESLCKIFLSLASAEEYAKILRSRLDDLGRHARGNNNACVEKSTRYMSVTLDGFAIDYTGAWVIVGGPHPFQAD